MNTATNASNSLKGTSATNVDSLNRSLDKFKQYVTQLHEIEYGDFKRKLSLYVMRLEESLPAQDILAQRVVATIRDRIIYNPRPGIDIDVAKLEVLDLVKRLENR